MLDFRRKEPKKPFQHAHDCKIFKLEPSVEIKWSETRRGVWEAVCVCGKDYHYEPVSDGRIQLDPYDPSTFRLAPQCEQRDITDPVLLKILLKVHEGTGGPYHWVTCGACDTSWQVLHYAAESEG